MSEPGLAGLWHDPHGLTALVGLVGIVVWCLIPRRRANTRLIVQIPFFLAMTAMLLTWRIPPYEPPLPGAPAVGTVLDGLAKLMWWLHLAWAVIGVVRLTLFIERRPREARLLQDVVVGLVYAGTLLSILAFVFAVPVATLIATSGALAIILGLALQNTLSDVFSGIALNLGRSYRLGDFITLADGTEGRVVATDWRATKLRTFGHNVVVLPHSVLAKVGLTNVSDPDESHGISVTVRLMPTRTPAATVALMRDVLASCNTILRDPPPEVVIKGIDAAALEMDLFVRIARIDQRVAARNEIVDLVYRHCLATGLRLAQPPNASFGVLQPFDGRTQWTPLDAFEPIGPSPT